MPNGLDYFGIDDVVGFDYGTLLQAAGGLATGIAAQAEEKQATEKASGDEQKKLAVAIAADLAASNTAAQADVSTQLKRKSASADASAAKIAADAQDRAAQDLSPDSAKKRADAAEKSLAFATKQAQENPKDGYKAALVKAWTTTFNKAHNVAITGDNTNKKGKEDQEPWLRRRVLGPLPGYAVLVLSVGILGGIGIAVKKIFFR